MNWKRIAYGTVVVLGGTLLGAVVGVVIGRFFISGTGFDAIADALGYAMLGAGTGFLGCLYAAWQLSPAALRRWAFLLGGGALLFIAFFLWRTQQESRSTEPVPPLRPTAPAEPLPTDQQFSRMLAPGSTSPPAELKHLSSDPEVIGFGFVSVPFSASGLHLSFFASPDLAASPVDSLIYRRGENGLEQLVYAPPSLVPFYLKEDYQLLYLRMTGLSKHRIEVITNDRFGQRSWVNRSAVSILFWPDFIQSVFAIEPLAADDFPLRTRPLDHAPPVDIDPHASTLLPQWVSGEWVKVQISTNGGADTHQMAWMRWRIGDRLLVSWSYLL